mmetsp:Transcript_26609/g.32647  ORF Transcript_26609/g.32647 Transcript_26609/m.32647 type:complete len:853 (-) Transcript_26609:38-2596(-)
MYHYLTTFSSATSSHHKQPNHKQQRHYRQSKNFFSLSFLITNVNAVFLIFVLLSLTDNKVAAFQAFQTANTRSNKNSMMLQSLLRIKTLRATNTGRTLIRQSRLFSSTTPPLDNEYDVIIIGGGHAGSEAASASARTGAKTALVTQRIDTIGELSCNPSIGGIGKGHLVREIDALDGVMGECADLAGIHFRMLNRRKGPAVRGPRAQADRDLYKSAMQNILKCTPNLHLIEGGVEDLLLEESCPMGVADMTPLAPFATNDKSSMSDAEQQALSSSISKKARVSGVKLANGREIRSRAVVVTTGTFLRGVLMIGHDRYVGGRHLRDSEEVEPPSVGLAKTLERFGFPLNRLKTGTPARLDARTIDFDVLVEQPSETPPVPFSHIRQGTMQNVPNIDKLIKCYQTETNEETHKIVMEYAHLLPQYDALDGKGNGPRYCPSIFKKVERFPDRQKHNSFLEPEGINSNIIYPNGMSGPYPEEIQLKIMRSMKGLSNVDILSPGYDVEYDFVNPQCLTHTLETKSIHGLYLAGQICGTTGYEEAAAQGIVAGANAGRSAGAASKGDKAPSPLVFGRDEAYIGVLIDDLVTRGTSEPYRMFTSRAEYRISLRADNADIRLTRQGANHGLVIDPNRLDILETRERMIGESIHRLQNFKLLKSEWGQRGTGDQMAGNNPKQFQKKSAEEILQMPHVTLDAVEGIIAKEGEHLLELEQQKVDDEEELNVADDYDGPPIETKAHRINKIMTLLEPSPLSIYDTVEASIKYKSYAARQERDMDSWRKAQGQKIPPDLVYEHSVFPTFSSEELEKLRAIQPKTFAEAAQISGVTPQSLVYLHHFVMKRGKQRDRLRRAEELSTQ